MRLIFCTHSYFFNGRFKVNYSLNPLFHSPFYLKDPCDPPALVCLVPAYEASGWGASAFSLSQQASTEQPDQHRPQHEHLSLPMHQWQHALCRRAWPGEHSLLHCCHLVWLRGPLRTPGRTGRRGRDAHPSRSGHPSWKPRIRDGQDPGWGALHREKVPRPRRGWVCVQRVEIRRLRYRQALSHGFLTLHYPLHYWYPHVSTQLCRGNFQRLFHLVAPRK